jgi:hypothetical protein
MFNQRLLCLAVLPLVGLVACGGLPKPTSQPLAAACADGVVKDDGQLETGYGFVPSAIWGMYVQEYNSAELESRDLERVCVCWLRTRQDADIDYEVVFFEKKEGRPAAEPFTSVKALAKAVPEGRASGGKFYDVDVKGVKVPEGSFYVGVRFNPGLNTHFFVCADHGPETGVVNTFQREDRAPGWQSVLVSDDPIFDSHRSAMIRLKAKKAPEAPPAPAKSKPN